MVIAPAPSRSLPWRRGPLDLPLLADPDQPHGPCAPGGRYGDLGDVAAATTPGTPTGAGATTAQCRGVREVEAESVAYLVAAAHGLPTDDYTFAYVTGWAAGVDRNEPEKVVRDTGARVQRYRILR